eukprot:GILK01010527.1.p1 GENE.GILK01010527.1~~GILK01010527.1.p1  ORF type:complete len:196 (+),score=12.18 GILK01010527.1:61-648(+)
MDRSHLFSFALGGLFAGGLYYSFWRRRHAKHRKTTPDERSVLTNELVSPLASRNVSSALPSLSDPLSAPVLETSPVSSTHIINSSTLSEPFPPIPIAAVDPPIRVPVEHIQTPPISSSPPILSTVRPTVRTSLSTTAATKPNSNQSLLHHYYLLSQDHPLASADFNTFVLFFVLLLLFIFYRWTSPNNVQTILDL